LTINIFTKKPEENLGQDEHPPLEKKIFEQTKKIFTIQQIKKADD
jgi:hypothetical protein